MSMMVPDGVDVEHEVVQCAMCIVKEMHKLKNENEMLRKEMEEMRLKTVNKKKEGIEVNKQEDN